MIVDNLGKERRCLGEYLPEVFETCLANFFILPPACLFVLYVFPMGKSIKFLPLHIINL